MSIHMPCIIVILLICMCMYVLQVQRDYNEVLYRSDGTGCEPPAQPLGPLSRPQAREYATRPGGVLQIDRFRSVKDNNCIDRSDPQHLLRYTGVPCTRSDRASAE